MLGVAAVVPTGTLVLLHLSVIHQTYIHTNPHTQSFTLPFVLEEPLCLVSWWRNVSPPVVKRSWVSAKGLASDMEGIVLAECRAGGREVEAGEDWVRTRGWWGQIMAGALGGSSWRPDLRITCLWELWGRGWRGEKRRKGQITIWAKLPHAQS